MNSESEATRVAEYISKLTTQNGHDNAFHSLLELNKTWLPKLVTACRIEPDPDRKASLVQIIWRSGQKEIIPFLGGLLIDSSNLVWKEALNGLVAFHNLAAINQIKCALVECKRQGDGKKQKWLLEAIDQIQELGEQPISTLLELEGPEQNSERE